MATVRELITKWGFSVNDAPLKKLEKNLTKIKTTVKVVGGIAFGAAGSIFGLAQSFAMTGDNVAKTADKLGIGIAALQELRFAADLAGVSSGNFDNSIRFLARNMGDAVNGIGEAKDAFKELGVSIKDINTGQLRKSEDVLADISEAFKNLTDDTKKVTLAMDIFGRSGADMINLMNQGKTAILGQRQEARDLGIVLSDVAARDSEKFIDAQTRLKAAFSGIRNILGEDLLPAIIGYTDSFRKFVVANREFVKIKITAFLSGMLKIIKSMVIPFNIVTKTFSRFIDLLGGSEVAASRLLKILGAIAFVQIAGVIGNIAVSLFQLAKGFKFAGNAAIFAQAKALAFPILIGASIIALGLLFEDFFVFMKGGESVFENFARRFGIDAGKLRNDILGIISDIRTIIKALRTFFNRVQRQIDFLKKILFSFFDRMQEKIDDLAKALFDFFTFAKLQKKIDVIAKALFDLFTFAKLQKKIDRLAESLFDFFDFDKTQKKINSLAESVSDFLGFSEKDVNVNKTETTNQSGLDATGIIDNKGLETVGKSISRRETTGTVGRAIANNSIGTPSPLNAPVRPPPVNIAGGSQSFNINAPISIKVPEGTPIERIAPQISAEIKDTFDTIIRNAARSNKPAVVF